MPSLTRRLSDLVLAVFVIVITALLLIPLPTPLLDLLLSLNLAVSLLLLLVGLYTPNALTLLSFPSLLLLTTLFRLGLNVASARLILSDGYAGKVIEAFGSFLIRGEVVVGMIIFIIITIVNFIVVARGASRVSEVAARFALDAMPGRQMAIDADLRAGVITRQEAEKKRDELRKESQLYGAMDGAMKFVQGDAIAGLFIILTNIIGGLYLGTSSGMSLSDAVQTYTVLTVGDGLVSQVPALLISICAGIVVTRVSSGENTTLGMDVGTQLLSRPANVMFAGLVLMAVGAMPGLPHLAFISMGLLFVVSGILLRRPRSAQTQHSLGLLDYHPNEQKYSAPSLRLESHEVLSVHLDANLLFKLYSSEAQQHMNWWQDFQKDYYGQTGVNLPECHVMADAGLAAGSYSLRINGVEIEQRRLVLDAILLELNPEMAEVYGLQVLQEEEHPFTGSRIFWAAQNAGLRRIIDAAQLGNFNFMQYIFMRAAVFINHNPEEIITLASVHGLLKDLDKEFPGFVSEALKQHFITPARLTEVLQQLLREGVSIRDFSQIVESISAYCGSFGLNIADSENFDLNDMISYIRRSRRRQVLAGLSSERRTLKICTLSPELELALEQSLIDQQTDNIAVDPELYQKMRKSLEEVLEPVRLKGIWPVSVLCRPDLRPKVQRMVRTFGRRIGVLSYDELDPIFSLEPVGVWAV